jgi:hypothetical protein
MPPQAKTPTPPTRETKKQKIAKITTQQKNAKNITQLGFDPAAADSDCSDITITPHGQLEKFAVNQSQ